jgi:hypothetical protein
MSRLLSRLLRRQEGIAMPVVIGTLTLTTAIAATTFTVVIEGNHASVRDRDSKRALAAAEAGLQMAILKTTELKPGSGQCVTNSLVVPGSPSNDGSTTSPAECPRWKASIGNGATYTYVVATPASGTCPTVPGFTATPDKDRCITSIGEVNGVKRRVQLKFYFNPPFVPWGNAGLVAKDLIDLGNNATINSPVGTNGEVVAGNNTDIIGELLLPPGAQYDFGQHSSASGGVRTPRVDPWTFPEIDWTTPRTEGLGFEGTAGWNATTRILTLSNNQPLHLMGGTYHVCGLVAPNGNDITVQNGQVARLYVDSARDGNCAAAVAAGASGIGRLTIKNHAEINNTDDKNPAELEVYAYGTTDDASDDPADIDINNGVHFFGTIWAPNSTLSIKNNEDSGGGFTAGNIDMKNNGGFQYDDRVQNKSLPGTATARNLSWFECKRDPTVTNDPESGCS